MTTTLMVAGVRAGAEASCEYASARMRNEMTKELRYP